MSIEARPDTEPTEAHRDKVKRALRSRARLDAIRRTGLADLPPSSVPSFERAARLAAHALRAPVAQVNLLTDNAQIPMGVYAAAPDDPVVWRTQRQSGSSYCKYVIWTRQPFIVEDAQSHMLVRQGNATRELSIRAYLGVPVHAPPEGGEAGPVIGSVCVVDHEPRQWSATDVEVLLDIAASVTDEIEHRVHRQEEAEQVGVRAARILENASVAVMTTDAEGVTTYANPAALRMLGYTASEILGHDQHALIHHSRPDGSRYPEKDCPNYIGRKSRQSVRSQSDTFWRSDGAAITVDSTMTPILDHGEVIGTVLTFQDVTERHAAETAEHSARLAAEAANRAKTALVAELSQEVRVPLAALVHNLDALEGTLIASASPEQRSELANLRRGVKHLAELVDNMSGFATIERHGESPN